MFWRRWHWGFDPQVISTLSCIFHVNVFAVMSWVSVFSALKIGASLAHCQYLQGGCAFSCFCSVLFTALTIEVPATLQMRIVINAILSVRLRLLEGGGIDVRSMSHVYGFPDHLKN